MKLLLPLILAAPALAVAAVTDSPQWRGPNRDGVFPATGLVKEWPKEGPRLLWQTKGLGKGLSSVAISGGKLFTLGERKGSQWLIALDVASQRELWATRISEAGNDPQGTPTVDGDQVFALSKDGVLLCARAIDGSELWRRSYARDFGDPPKPGWGFAESPLIDGQKVIVTPGSKESFMVALDRKTGNLLWKTEWSATGKGHEGAGYTGPVVSNAAGIRQYVTMVGKGAIGVDASTGKLLWHYNRVANGTAVIPTPLVWDDYVFVSSGYGTGAALLKIVKDAPAAKSGAAPPTVDMEKVAALEKTLSDLNKKIAQRREMRSQKERGTPDYDKANEAVQSLKPEIEKTEQALATAQGRKGNEPAKIPGSPVSAEEQYFLEASTFQNHHGGMVRIGDYIYAGKGHNNGFPVCIEWKTGRVVWDKGRGPGKESAAVVAADGKLFFRYQDGTMALIEATPAGYAEKGAFKLPHIDGPSWSHPVIHDGRLYLRDQDALMCYSLR